MSVSKDRALSTVYLSSDVLLAFIDLRRYLIIVNVKISLKENTSAQLSCKDSLFTLGR